jgi:hypothetical protein
MAMGRMAFSTGLLSIGSVIVELESASTSFSESGVEFEGGYLDPSSGTEVKVGLQAAWTFDSANSIVSRATLSGRKSVDDFGGRLDKAHAWEWLLAKAKSVGYANEAGIIQGFGVITAATTSIGGINIGPIEDKSSFSIVGSVDGVTAMAGGGNGAAGIKGSYKEEKESKSFDSHTWPVAHNSVAPGTGEVALTYLFTTFDGTAIMPTWARRIGNFTIAFDNAHGGTYVGRCYGEYSVPGSTELKFGDQASEKKPEHAWLRGCVAAWLRGCVASILRINPTLAWPRSWIPAYSPDPLWGRY